MVDTAGRVRGVDGAGLVEDVTMDPWDLIGMMGDLLKQTARERNDLRSDVERLRADLVVEREATRAVLALMDARDAVSGPRLSDPAVVGAGEVGGGGGSEPPPSPPDMDARVVWDGLYVPLIGESPLLGDGCGYCPKCGASGGEVTVDGVAGLKLCTLCGDRWAGMYGADAWRDNPDNPAAQVLADCGWCARDGEVHPGCPVHATAEGEGGVTSARDAVVRPDDHAVGAPSRPEPVADSGGSTMVDGSGLPAGYKCDYCPRVLATSAGKNRHIGQAHRREHVVPSSVTAEQAAAQEALLAGDRHGGKRDVVEDDGLVGCGFEGCTARRSVDAIERHRLSMHGVSS